MGKKVDFAIPLKNQSNLLVPAIITPSWQDKLTIQKILMVV